MNLTGNIGVSQNGQRSFSNLLQGHFVISNDVKVTIKNFWLNPFHTEKFFLTCLEGSELVLETVFFNNSVGESFNLYNQSMRSIVETISDLEYDDAYGQVIGNLPNGRTSSTQVFQPILFNNEDSAVVKVTYSVINTQRRMVSGEDVAVYKFSIEGDLGNKELNPWDSISFEGINLGITRNQFIDNVKINNPIFNNPDDSSFQTADFFDKAFVKEKDIRSISYVLDERLDEKGRPSYVRFMFRNEILTRIDVNCTLDYLDLEVQ